MDKETYRILVVDDHPVVAEGILGIASQLEGVACQKSTCLEEVERLTTQEPFDLCIIDLELPGCSGFELIDRLHGRMPECRILIYTMHEEPWVIAKLSTLDIGGAVSKSCPLDELVRAIRELRSGNSYFCNSFAKLDRTGKNPALHSALQPPPELSKREKEVLDYLSQGMNTAEISARMFLSTNTIQTYRKRLLEKLDAHNVAELVCKGKEMF